VTDLADHADELDGCDIVGPEATAHPLADADVPWLVLFADVDPDDRHALRTRRREWRALFP
jgi:hypothetical protein